jgi:hypothetical protein
MTSADSTCFFPENRFHSPANCQLNRNLEKDAFNSWLVIATSKLKRLTRVFFVPTSINGNHLERRCRLSSDIGFRLHYRTQDIAFLPFALSELERSAGGQ